MGGKKKYKCSACEKTHEKPTGFACKCVPVDSDSDIPLGQNVSDIPSTSSASNESKKELLSAIKFLGDKIDSMEKRLVSTEQELKLVKKSTVSASSPVVKKKKSVVKPVSSNESSSSGEESDDFLLASAKTIKTSRKIQRQVDARLQQLRDINERDFTGKFKSQRGGGEDVTVKF